MELIPTFVAAGGENQDLALQYYLQSLAERRQYASVAEGDLVPTLNNVGMQYCRRHNFGEWTTSASALFDCPPPHRQVHPYTY